MDFNSMNEMQTYIRELSEEQTAALADVEVWVSDSGAVCLDDEGIVDNNENYDGYVLKGTLNEYW